ncbi:MAG: hypothetical protein L0Y58_20110 [Verrucomicrobia subdivision 3 bacterium]|nr:hypothetical protein [Limisphaerales bacterium]
MAVVPTTSAPKSSDLRVHPMAANGLITFSARSGLPNFENNIDLGANALAIKMNQLLILCTWVNVLVGIGPGDATLPNETGSSTWSSDRFVSEYKRAYELMEKRMSNVRVRGKLDAWDAVGNATLKRIGNSCLRVVDNPEGKKRDATVPIRTKYVVRYGDEFCFRLEQQPQDRELRVAELIVFADENLSQRESLVKRIQVERSIRVDQWAAAPIFVYGEWFAKSLATGDGKVRIEKLYEHRDEKGQKLLRVYFSIKDLGNALALVEAFADFQLELGFAISRIHTDTQFRDKSGAQQLFTEDYVLKYDSPRAKTNHFPDSIDCSKGIAGDPNSYQRHTFVTDDIAFGVVTEDELKISAFGLPESLVERNRPRSKWSYIVLGGAAILIGIGLYLFRSRARRDSLPQSNK